MSDETIQGREPIDSAPGTDTGVERFHMWAPRPLLRSTLWTPRGSDSDHEPLYEVFIAQSTLASIIRHLRDAPEDERPFGLLAGDLCEDPDGGNRYVLIRDFCRSSVSLTDRDGDQIPATAWEDLRTAAEGRSGSLVGWYLRHRPGEMTLSDAEVATHAKYFNEPWHSAILLTADPNEPMGCFFRRTENGFSGSNPLPFYELVSADAMGGSQRQTYVDWDGVETRESVKREAIPSFGESSDTVDDTEGKSDRGRPAAQTGAFAAEVARRSIAAAASKTAEVLDRRRQAAAEAAREAEEEAARRAAELEAARTAAEELARRASEEAAAREVEETEAERREAERAAEEAEEAARVADEEAARRSADLRSAQEAAEKAEQRAAELESALRATEEESARRLAAENAARRAAEEEAARQAAEAETARKTAAEETERRRSEEAARIAAEQEAARKVAELQSARNAAEAEAERHAEELQRTIR
ncbi:MAG: hypothetical protein M8862_10525, partial [marine benthic group bacterium]|nr:hypothetical protein [Gemmatimonadota bacterium]